MGKRWKQFAMHMKTAAVEIGLLEDGCLLMAMMRVVSWHIALRFSWGMLEG